MLCGVPDGCRGAQLWSNPDKKQRAPGAVGQNRHVSVLGIAPAGHAYLCPLSNTLPRVAGSACMMDVPHSLAFYVGVSIPVLLSARNATDRVVVAQRGFIGSLGLYRGSPLLWQLDCILCIHRLALETNDPSARIERKQPRARQPRTAA